MQEAERTQDHQIAQKVEDMSNYPDHEERLMSLEQQVLAIHEKLEKIVQMLQDLEERLEPAVTAQRIRDEWDGLS